MIDEVSVTDQSQTMADGAVEETLLAALIRRDPAPLVALVRGEPELWAVVCARARDHRCLPYLHWIFDQAGVSPPVSFTPALRQNWALRALSIQRECLRLHHILADSGIAHLFLKGVPLAVAAYPEPWLRPLRDIDLLVAPEDLERAQAVLFGHGGAMEQYAHRAGEEVDTASKHLVPVWSPGQVIAVELHGRAMDVEAGPEPETGARLDAALWASLTEIPVAEAVLPVPGPEALFVHLVHHGVYDHELNNGPLFVTDLIHLLEQMRPDPHRIVALAEDLGIARGLALSLSLISQDTAGRAEILAVLQATGTIGTLPALSGDSAAALLLQDGESRTDLRLSVDLSGGSWWQRLRFLTEKTFASRKTMTDRWRMEGHTTLPPVSAFRLWLWFVAVRLRSLRRSGRSQPENRSHLKHLRALRDGLEP